MDNTLAQKCTNNYGHYKHLDMKFRFFSIFSIFGLTISLDLSISAAVQYLSVVSSGTAASPVAIQSPEWVPVWISTATSFVTASLLSVWFRSASTLNPFASFVSVGVSGTFFIRVAWIESVSMTVSC